MKCPTTATRGMRARLKFFPSLAERLGRKRGEIAVLCPLGSRIGADFLDPSIARNESLAPAGDARPHAVDEGIAHRPRPEAKGRSLGSEAGSFFRSDMFLNFTAQVQQQVGNVDAHRADFAAGPAER